MGNPTSKFVHSSVFPDLINAKSTSEIREWLEASQFALSPNTIHYTSYKTGDETDNICLVYLHGNAEDVCSVERFKRCQAYKLVAFEYPGYGIRQGEIINEEKLVDAIPDMTKWLQENVPEDKKIVICGRSLGSFVAVRLAHELQDRCKALILISPMLSAISTRVAAPWYHLLWPLDLINNREFILQTYANVTADVLLIHGQKDSVVPCWHSQQLAELIQNKTSARVTVRTVPRADHNDIFVHNETWKHIDCMFRAENQKN